MFLAPKLSRFLNLFFDTMVDNAFSPLISLLLSDFLKQSLRTWESIILLLLVHFLYYFLCERTWGKTLGKFVTKTRVVAKDGKKPTDKQLIIRNLVRFIPFEVLSFLVMPIGAHDLLSDTRVITEKNE